MTVSRPDLCLVTAGLVCAVAMVLSGAVDASQSDRQSLIQIMKLNGQNEFEDERHAVEITDCTIKTFRWKNHPDSGWTLWSSFEFPMQFAELPVTQIPGGGVVHFISVDAPPDHPEGEMALIPFTMTDGEVARFERSNHRTRPPEARDSPRGDGTTHHIKDSDSFFVLHQGAGVVAKARAFTDAYVAYVKHHCTFTG